MTVVTSSARGTFQSKLKLFHATRLTGGDTGNPGILGQSHQVAGCKLRYRPRAGPIAPSLMGFKREQGTKPLKQATPLLEILPRFLAAYAGSTAAELRDNAVLLLGFASAPRRTELVALDLFDVEFDPLASSSTSPVPRPIRRARATRRGPSRRQRGALLGQGARGVAGSFPRLTRRRRIGPPRAPRMHRRPARFRRHHPGQGGIRRSLDRVARRGGTSRRPEVSASAARAAVAGAARPCHWPWSPVPNEMVRDATGMPRSLDVAVRRFGHALISWSRPPAVAASEIGASRTLVQIFPHSAMVWN
jgi:hypothetical protein